MNVRFYLEEQIKVVRCLSFTYSLFVFKITEDVMNFEGIFRIGCLWASENGSILNTAAPAGGV